MNPVRWEDIAQDSPARRRSVKTVSAIYEANRIATTKTKRAARKSPAPRNNTVDAQALPTCPRCQCISARELAWLDIFGRNAPTIRQFLLLREILPTLLRTPPPSLLASIPLLPPS
ncbi:unnamed protein product [Schistocephalus solidus]|uniref:Transposase n=1 Tax=Schistocephalus solidus TaxID=70667 RepID=A0A183SPU8_SCHSO|nr:unnamed protein product [Schistocephalus solidus]